jgi:5'-AMP-activated protein kinase catalytic alpha subunit
MHEVFRAMKTLDYEWKVVNPFHVRVRRKNPMSEKLFTKMSLQLYQVDQKSYLLDFKSLNTPDHPDAKRVERMTRSAMHKSLTSESALDMEVDGPQQHQTLEFFEMCANLITTLAK